MSLTFLGDVYLPQVFDAHGLEIENSVLNLEALVTTKPAASGEDQPTGSGLVLWPELNS